MKNNEIILVQNGMENVFYSYVDGKVSDLASGGLTLRFPEPGCVSSYEFSEFYESPFRVDRRKSSFDGYFIIDLTSYVGSENSPRLSELVDYIKSNSDTTYVLYARVPSLENGRLLARKLNRDLQFPMLCYRNKEAYPKTMDTATTRKSFGY